MNQDDTIYISLLIISIPIGFVFKNWIRSGKTRAYISSGIGLGMAAIVCTYDIYHSLLVALVNSLLIIAINPRYVPIFSFLWCFGYLLFFRLTYMFGLEKPVAYANAVQLILTLKMVGLAFEVHDANNRKRKALKLNEKIGESLKKLETTADEETENAKLATELAKVKLEMEFVSLEPRPSFLQMFMYAYCYIGLLTGPYFKYRTYSDWLNNRNAHEIDSVNFVIKRGRIAPFIVIGFLILSKFVSFKDALADSFYESSFGYRMFYMVLIFTLFRFRFYVAWIFAEFSCITAGFGAYPERSKPKPGAGPTDLSELKSLDKKSLKSHEYSFLAVHNIDEYKCETALSVKQVLHYWNMTVQYWMASYVYKRVPLKQLGQPITMAVSAYWHGLHAGYYLSMLTTSPCILAENLMDKGFKRRFLDERYYKYYDFCAWLFRTREFDYMSLGFILLSYEETMRFWRSVYFVGHLVCLFFICVGFVLCRLAPPPPNKKSQ